MNHASTDTRQTLQHQPWCDRHVHASASEGNGGYWPHCIGRIIEIDENGSQVGGWWHIYEGAGNELRFFLDDTWAHLDEDAMRAIQAVLRNGYGDQLLRLVTRALADLEDGIPADERA